MVRDCAPKKTKNNHKILSTALRKSRQQSGIQHSAKGNGSKKLPAASFQLLAL
jgi:hypothetical protein